MTKILIETEYGAITAELYPDKAPLTVANFLRYVAAGFYQDGRFWRTVTLQPDNQPNNVVKIEVIQAGVNPIRADDMFAPIPLERTTLTGLRHGTGALSMARFAPDSAQGDFFICIGAQPSLDFGGDRNPDGQGFAAFGQVIDGMTVVQRIQNAACAAQTLTPPIQIRNISLVDG